MPSVSDLKKSNKIFVFFLSPQTLIFIGRQERSYTTISFDFWLPWSRKVHFFYHSLVQYQIRDSKFIKTDFFETNTEKKIQYVCLYEVDTF